MKTLIFEDVSSAQYPPLRNAQVAKGDPWKRALERRQDCTLLLTGNNQHLLLARLHWGPKQKEQRVEAPAGFLGLEGDAIYLDEVDDRKWWQKIFRN